MAYVRKTQQLLDDITSHVCTMQRQAINVHSSKNLDTSDQEYKDMCDAATTVSYLEAPELRGKLPESWTKKVDSVRLTFVEHDDKKIAVVSLSEPLVLPKHVDSNYYHTDIRVKYDQCSEVLKAWLQGEAKRVDIRRETEKQYDDVKQQLSKFMDQQASLNSALKDMPEIELYIPLRYMVKIREQAEPRASKKANVADELNIDTDALASIAIAHRMATATQ